MTHIEKEKSLDLYPLPVTIEGTNTILEQMKKCICKIENKNGNGTGFLCYIPYNNTKIEVMITNNHIINEDIIKNNKIIQISINDNKEKKRINIEKRNIYTSVKYDTTIIPINSNEDKIYNYLDIDEEIFDENINIFNKSIYILQYPKNKINDEQKAAVSYGILKNIQDEYNIVHFCCTDNGSSGSPILLLSNKKIIGIHKESVNKYNYNRGTYLKYPINEYLNNFNKNNEINMKIKIEKEDINKNIYFLDNTDGKYQISENKNDIVEHHHDNLKELNESNAEIYINNKKYEYIKYFKPEKEGEYEIKLKFNINITDCSFMFCLCSNLTNIEFTSFDTTNVTNMASMFSGCSNLTNINLSSFDTKNVINMKNMFFGCSNLINLNLTSFDTKNLNNMIGMFGCCSKLESINLSSFDTKNVTSMEKLFVSCSNLTSIDLTSFDTRNVTDMSHMFGACSNLKNIEFTYLDTSNVSNMDNIFACCFKLEAVKIGNEFLNYNLYK